MTEVNFTVARTLIERPDRYGPLFAVDKRNNDILWELWVTGFEKAVKLRPAAWQRLLIADRETALAMSGPLRSPTSTAAMRASRPNSSRL